MTEANELVWLAPSELAPWKDNPRNNDGEPVAKVAHSIQRFGFGAPIVARAGNKEIIAGHTRWKAAKKLGLERVPVRLLDIDEHDAHLLALADNRLTELTGWSEQLPDVLKSFATNEQELAGWTANDIKALEKGRGAPTQGLEDDEIPTPPKIPVTQAGDTWRLGKHKLVCGDCRDAGVNTLLLDRPINVAFTSPPYASQRKYDEASGFKPIAPDEYVAWFEAVQARVREGLAADGSWFVNIKEHCDDGQRSLYVKDLTTSHVRAWGWRFVDELVWTHHGFPGQVIDRFKNAWEPIFHFARQYPVKCRPQQVAYESDSVMRYDKDAHQSMSGAGWQGAGRDPVREKGLALPRNVLHLSNGAATSVAGHSATFPVQLPTFFILAYSDDGDAIFDPFMGSGTTMIAAEQLGRSAYGIELSPAYCDVVVERWQNLTGGKAQRQAG